jgi:hypothetical protein
MQRRDEFYLKQADEPESALRDLQVDTVPILQFCKGEWPFAPNRTTGILFQRTSLTQLNIDAEMQVEEL